MAARLSLNGRPRVAAALALAALALGAGLAAADPPAEPDGLPLRPTRAVAFDTDEGTWLSLSVSPDGRSIAFDLLGDLYAVSADGGSATPLSRGLSFDSQPAYSPDGQWLAFTSDRSGADNVWVARRDGRDARQVSGNDGPDEFVSPAWSADGGTLYASRVRPDENAAELWRFRLDGREPPAELTGGKKSALGAVASRDGRYLYYASSTSTLFEDDVVLPRWAIERLTLATGTTETIVTAQGSAMRPVLSPDGRTLAYATRIGHDTGLRLRDLESGADRLLAWPIQRDAQEALPTRDLIPGYAFTPDGAAVLAAIDGRIRRIDLATGASVPVPFSAHVALDVGPFQRHPVAEPAGPITARLIQHPRESPDGRRLAFTALGHVYVEELARGRAVRLTQGTAAEAEAAWSPDGRQLAYVSWDARAGGGLWLASAGGRSTPRPLAPPGSFYTDPAFSPDGTTIYALRSSAYARAHTAQEPALWLKRSFGSLRQADLVAIPAAGGAPRRVASGVFGGAAQFVRTDTQHLYLNTERGLEAVALDGGARRLVLSVVGPGYYFLDGPVAADDLELSPDAEHALALVGGELHLLDLAGRTDLTAPIDVRTSPVPHRELTSAGADYASWGRDGGTIGWSVGPTYLRRPLAGLPRDAAPGEVGERPVGGHDGVEAFRTAVTVPRDLPRGALVLRGATVLTMAGDQVVTDADVVVVDRRVAAVGTRGSVAVPPGATIRDVSGRFIVPGLIDVHDHFGDVRREVLDFDNWGFAATLAYGVTASLDPSTLTVDMLAYQDLLDAGAMLGPRLYSTGPAVFSFFGVRSQARADDIVGKYAHEYGLTNLKEYRTGSRRSREFVAIAAERLGLIATTEGALDMKLDLTQILDGFAGNEHALVAIPLKRDVIELLARTRTSYTPTLQISHGGPPAGEDFIARTEPLNDAKVERFYPRFIREKLFSRVHWTASEQHAWPGIAAGAAAVQRAGGVVGVGSHGNYPGLGYHWELQALAAGGLSPTEVLRAATQGSAETIGRGSELGSLEPGKLADLLVLARDPRADIAATLSVREVLKNGRLFDADTLAEEWPEPRPAPRPWFRDEPPAPPRH